MRVIERALFFVQSSGKGKGSLRNQLEGYLSHWRTKIGFKSKKDVRSVLLY